MAKATWNGAILAESDETIVVEGNHYFPLEAINRAYFKHSESQTICPWKGVASYYDVEVAGQINRGAAWTYRDPRPAARQIKEYVAFWRGVAVTP